MKDMSSKGRINQLMKERREVAGVQSNRSLGTIGC